ncbi:MAG: cyclic nucleotide-binding domain-containing protein [Verrucomicrobiota bacterium]
MTTAPVKLDALSNKVYLFSWLEEDKLNFLFNKAQIISLDSGNICIESEAPNDGIHIVCSGSIEVLSGSEESRDVLCTLIEGDFFGEQCLLQKSITRATFKALEDKTLVYFISNDLLQEFEASYPDQFAILISNLARFYSRTLRSLNDRLSLSSQAHGPHSQ